MKTLKVAAALLSLVSLVGCAAAEPEGVSDDGTVEATSEAVTVDPASLGDDLVKASTIPICADDSAVGKNKSVMFDIFDGSSGATCVPRTYERGVGVPMGCASGLIQSGAICYRACKSGYTMVAGVCWQSSCPAGFRNDGAYCAKPAAYGRGAGYALWQEGKCEDAHAEGCEKYGAMWYPKCKESFHNVGSNICSPDCPSGMTDIGVSCAKKTYVQNSSNTTPISYSWFPEVNTPIFTAPLNTCPADKSERYGELCYEPCIKGFKGVDDRCVYAD